MAYWIGLALGVVGGGVGVTIAAPLVRIPREVSDHDLRVDYMNQSSRRWIADRKVYLDRDTAAELVSRGNMYPNEILIGIRQDFLEDAEHELARQVEAVELDYATMMNHERWWHRIWIACFRTHRPSRPALTIRSDAVAALAQWRDQFEGIAERAGVAPRAWRQDDPTDG